MLRSVSVLIAAPAPLDPEVDGRGAGHLQEVLQSDCFKRATTLRSLLLYLWENRENDISEYAIAVEGLGRNRDFEAKIDASVRVQISRLRQFLARYYESEGRHSTVRLVIPIGTHQIQLVRVAPETEPGDYSQAADGIHSVSIVPPSPQPSRTKRLLVPVLSGVIVALLLCISWLIWSQPLQERRIASASRQELPLFWKMFFNNNKPTRIVLPTPVFFSWGPPAHEHTLIVRDTYVNDFAKLESSAPINDLKKRLGPPELWQNYTVASDTFASLRLARFLDSYGVQTSISSAPESPHGIIDHENIVTFGTFSSLAPFESDLARLSFKLAPHERYIIDKHLPAGSPGVFPALQESASRKVVPGIIALLPRGTSGSRILILQGIQTTAIISYLTSDAGMREITQAQAAQGNGPFFEAVLLSEVNEESPIQSRLVAFRRFTEPATPPNHIAESAKVSH
jgi:hypothetical protein